MSARRRLPLRWAAILLVQLCLPAYAQAQSLRHDVFARPSLESMQPARPAPEPSAAPADLKPDWNPGLRAVIVAGRESMANVDGTILRIGQKIDGYRLAEVREHEVVFVKNKHRYTLTLADIKGPGAAGGPTATVATGASGAEEAAQAQDAAAAKAAAAVPEAQTRGDMQDSNTKRRTP
jgi:hypothetical protein